MVLQPVLNLRVINVLLQLIVRLQLKVVTFLQQLHLEENVHGPLLLLHLFSQLSARQEIVVIQPVLNLIVKHVVKLIVY